MSPTAAPPPDEASQPPKPVDGEALAQVKKRLQDHFTDGLVTVVGLGHSAAFGLPTMGQLADALLDALPGPAGDANGVWRSVAARLQQDWNLEAALDAVDADDPIVGDIVSATADIVQRAEKKAISDILEGTQRLAIAELARFLAPGGSCTVITTNYDRLIELAVEMAGFAIDSSFLGEHFARYGAEASRGALRSDVVPRGRNLRMRYRRHVRICKPHGSLDWYVHAGVPLRTPHAVPLPRLMITPGSGKYRLGYNQPFDLHREQANRAVDNAARFLVIGYGFNDDHLQTHLEQRILEGAPCLVLTKNLTDRARGLSAAAPSSVIALESDGHGGTLLHMDDNVFVIEQQELWQVETFVDEVLK